MPSAAIRVAGAALRRYLVGMPVPEPLLEILRCPQSRAPLLYFRDDGEYGECLFCPESGLLYRVDDGLPVMLIEEATKLGEREAAALVARAPGG